ENNTSAETVKNYVAEYFSIEPEELLAVEVEKESPIYFVRVKDREVDREWIFGCTDRLIAEVLRDKHPHLNISDIPGILGEDTDTTLGIRNDIVRAVLKKVDYI